MHIEMEKEAQMKVVISIDSFKGSLTSREAGMAAKEGILRACPSSEVNVYPLADGGRRNCGSTGGWYGRGNAVSDCNRPLR